MANKKRATPQAGKPFALTRRAAQFIAPHTYAVCGCVYWEAAQAVYPSITKGSVEAYPLEFLCRHSIEAYLKAILCEGGSRIEMTCGKVRERGHDLGKQVPDVLRVARSFKMKLSRRTQNAINQIHGVDPGGDKFRYDNDGGATFNVEHFFEECEKVIAELREVYERVIEEMTQEATDAIHHEKSS